MLADRALALKRQADALWVDFAREAISTQMDEDAERINLLETQDLEDTRVKREIIAQQEVLALHPNSLYTLAYPWAKSLPDTLSNIVANAVILARDADGKQAAPGGIAAGNAVLAAYNFRLTESLLATRLKAEEKAVVRKSEARNQAAKLRAARSQLRAAGQPLDFSTRMSSILSMVAAMLPDIEDRCLAADRGLRAVFGTDKMGIFAAPAPTQATATLEQFWIWIRERLSFVTKFGAVDQGFTVLAHVEVPLGMKASFSFPESCFASHSNVRMRGVVAYLDGTQTEHVCRATVCPPIEAIYRIANGADRARSSDVIEMAANQSQVPPCTIGRVVSMTSGRQPEVAGTATFFNVSPIEKPGSGSGWSILVEPITKMAKGRVGMFIEISVVGRPLLPD